MARVQPGCARAAPRVPRRATMRPSYVFAACSAFGLLAAAAWVSEAATEPVVRQPIEFNHAVHAAEDISCDDCHPKADEGPYATFPSLKQCLLCHKQAQPEEGEEGEEPEEPTQPAEGEAAKDPAAAARYREVARKLAEFDELGEGVPWVQVNRVVGHVYFSHVAHVRFGEMKCEECHGDMATATKPPERSQVEHLSMRRCMDCHDERGASNDCLACHK